MEQKNGWDTHTAVSNKFPVSCTKKASIETRRVDKCTRGKCKPLGQVLEHVQHYLWSNNLPTSIKKSQHRIVIKVKGLDITFYFSKTPSSKPAIFSQSHPKNFNTWLTKVLIETKTTKIQKTYDKIIYIICKFFFKSITKP